MNKLIRKLILTLVFLGIFVIGYQVDLHYQGLRFLRAREQSHQLEENSKQTHQKILQTDQYKISLAQTRAEFDQVKITLPDAANIQSFINTTLHAGENQGLKFLTVNQQPVIAKDFYHILPVQLVILGTYQQFTNFLTGINTQHDFISINHFIMTRQKPAETTVLKNNNTPDMVVINATADFYYYP